MLLINDLILVPEHKSVIPRAQNVPDRVPLYFAE